MVAGHSGSFLSQVLQPNDPAPTSSLGVTGVVGGDERGALGVHGRRVVQGVEQVMPQIDREADGRRMDGGRLGALPFEQLQSAVFSTGSPRWC